MIDFIRALTGTVQLRGVFYAEPGLGAAVQATAARLSATAQARTLALLGPVTPRGFNPKAPRAAILVSP